MPLRRNGIIRPVRNSVFDLSLGRDFWYFRLGQLVSLLGDGCGMIALSWWILGKTGSAAQMSAVLAPAMAVRLVLLPLLGPVADKFSRKHLIALADFWRFAATAAIAALVYFDLYHPPLLIALYMLNSAGSALFAAASAGIVPQIVERDHLSRAVQQTHAVDSFARIAGGILGGLIVSFIGVFGAFVVDALSYLISGVATLLIRASTIPPRTPRTSEAGALTRWTNEFKAGFKVIYRVPVLFWLSIVAMFMNLILSPLVVLLPVLAKEARAMPPWFLGGLESSIGLGAVVGALSVGWMLARLRVHLVVTLAIGMIGVGVALLPWTPNVLLPLSVLFWIGIGQAWANVPIGTQISLSVPDSHRARVGSITGFLCGGMNPLGIAAAGLLVERCGLTATMLCLGGALLAMAPLLLLIPDFAEYMAASPEDAAGFFAKRYPGAFSDSA